MNSHMGYLELSKSEGHKMEWRLPAAVGRGEGSSCLAVIEARVYRMETAMETDGGDRHSTASLRNG